MEKRNNMPMYAYECSTCQNQFESVHSMTEQLHNCDKCGGQDTLKRIPQLLTSYSVDRQKITAGERVNRFIEDSRQLLKDSKEQSRKDYK
jgi:putative FmdB family regulatory protein